MHDDPRTLRTHHKDTPCRIGICDDVEAFRRLLDMLFSFEADMDVVGLAQHGREAVDLVTQQRVDVLLLDVAMPVMDGLEALPLIRAASPDTKVVMLTGFGTDAIRRRAIEGGANRYLEKGLAPTDLVAVVRQTWRS